VAGARVQDVLQVRSPRGLVLAGPDRGSTGLVLLTVRTAGAELVLRGELTGDGELLWFLGSPWVTDLAELAPLGLTLADFAAHDPVTDLLLLVQAQRSAQRDVEQLVERMRAAAAEQVRSREQEERLAAELRALPDLALRLDAGGTLLALRPAREGGLAGADERLVGCSAYDAFPWLAADLPAVLERALGAADVQELAARIEADGQVQHYEVRVVGAGPDEAVVLVRDVSERRALQDQLRHRAFHDPLTGLANRALLADRIDHALTRIAREATSPVLLLIDLDGFKAVNDLHGHLVGDELLTAVGQRLAALVRPEDTVARLGGDEFAVLLDDGGRAEGERVAARLLDSLSRPVHTSGAVLSTSASVGLVCAGGEDDLTTLFRHADMALYAAKQAGKHRCSSFDDEMRQRVQDQRSLELDLRAAIVDGQLLLHYQPIRDLVTGAVFGWEALVRWQHPELGLLVPEVFLRLAEDMGAMELLAVRALRRATLDAHRLGGLVHVNLSPAQLAEPAIVDVVAAALRDARLPGGRLVLEVTEAAMQRGSEAAVTTLLALRDLGVGLSLDDFGVGHSSLSRLHALPFTEIKVDRSFVAGLGDPRRSAIAATVIDLGTRMGLTVVAEGVETEQQASELRELGCRLGQGFHLGRPEAAP